MESTFRRMVVGNWSRDGDVRSKRELRKFRVPDVPESVELFVPIKESFYVS